MDRRRWWGVSVMAFGVGVRVGPFWVGKRLGGGGGGRASAPDSWSAGYGLAVLVVMALWVVAAGLWLGVALVLGVWGVLGVAGRGLWLLASPQRQADPDANLGHGWVPFRGLRWFWRQGVSDRVLFWRGGFRVRRAEVSAQTPRWRWINRAGVLALLGGLVVLGAVVVGAFYAAPVQERRTFVDGVGGERGQWVTRLIDIGENGSGWDAVLWWTWLALGVGVGLLLLGAVCRIRAGWADGAGAGAGAGVPVESDWAREDRELRGELAGRPGMENGGGVGADGLWL